ncbi:hypothetical protein DUI87_09826 [Hirundo rustica rustica]|uniref:Uncharacterized protein n=1 Tax=Hirundo rustica rustica TaxID=333673 RepID=A0A3M0KGH0_HIRRU|nr:hypothetical protein DUI87_09826 [Hirundo rustica rustica]
MTASTSHSPRAALQENSRVLKEIFLRTRDVTSYFILSPGTYSIVPAATEDQAFEFLLRIFIKNQDYNENSNSLISPGLPMGSTIDALQLQQLLNEVILQGLAASAQLLRLMTLRYGDAVGRVGFSDFVCCMLRLDTMTHAFQNLAEGGSQILMTAMEWLTLVMYT